MSTRILACAAMIAGMILATVGCTAPPTRAELDAADFGPMPDYELAKDVSEKLLQSRLDERKANESEPDHLLQIDAPSAEIDWDTAFHRSWYEIDSSTCFAWQLTAVVNARNANGELTGPQPWSYWFRYGSLVATAEPSRMGKAGYAVELPSPIPLRKGSSGTVVGSD